MESGEWLVESYAIELRTMTSLSSYRELIVWQKSMDLTVRIYALTRCFPAAERYGITSQMRRSASSIPANIAEGQARRSTGEFVQSLGVARGSLSQLRSTGGGPGSCEASGLGWVNTVLGNVKRALDGTYHAWGQKYAPRYLAEFSYRFNRRYQLADLVPRLAHVAVRTPPLPYRLLTVAGTYA